ncbi:MAG: type II toxin-antitoxin system PemK/MazF family toxin [Chloroflexi bacterium]|nr:type II toxin-antitoxin system PemK/MazF family toxin [Chloroflexota bacterium]
MTRILGGDVWWVSLDPAQGAEIQKTRPCLVLTADTLNRLRQTVVVVPFSTSAKPHPPISVSVTCEGRPVVAIIDQIRAVGRHRLKSRIESAPRDTIRAVKDALIKILELH